VVGAQQTFKDSSAPFDVTVSTYDFADETMAENYSYAMEVLSDLSTTGVRLFSVGVETSKRAY